MTRAFNPAAIIERRRTAHAERTHLAEDRWRRFQASSRRRYAKLRLALPAGVRRLLARGKPPGRFLLLATSGLWTERLDQGLCSAAGPAAGLWDYVRAGPDPSVRPRTLFDQAWYLAAAPELAASRWPPLAHYLIEGEALGLSPHPLFDPTVAPSGRRWPSALHWFLAEGAAGGAAPHPLFDVRYYVGRCEEVAHTGENPLIHYLRTGWREGLDPHPLFAGDWYLAAYPAAQAAGIAPLLHYVTKGAADGLDPHPLFDAKGYLKTAGGPLRAGDPLSDFLDHGARELRASGGRFHPAYYLHRAGQDPEARANPLLHYLTVGAFEGVWPAPDFDEAGYFAAQPEALDAPIAALDHWARSGRRWPRTRAAAAPQGQGAAALFDYYRAAAWADPAAYGTAAYQALRPAPAARRPQPPAPGAMPLHSTADVETVVLRPGARPSPKGRAPFVLFALPGTGATQDKVQALFGALSAGGAVVPVLQGADGVIAGARVAADATLQPLAFAGNPRQLDAPAGALALPRALLGRAGLDWTFGSGAYALADLALRLRAAGVPVRLAPEVVLAGGWSEPAGAARDAQRLLERHADAVAGLQDAPLLAFRRLGVPDWLKTLRAIPDLGREPKLPAQGLHDPGEPAQLHRDETLAARYGLALAHEVKGPADVARLEAAQRPHALAWSGPARRCALDHLAPLLAGRWAIHLDGRPLLVLPGAANAQAWREAARAAGLAELYLVARGAGGDPRLRGFDAALASRPKGKDYAAQVRAALARPPASFPELPCTAAAPEGRPGAFQAWLEGALMRVRAEAPPGGRAVFVEAWNDWAAGLAIAPDLRFGHGWLEACANARDAELLSP